MIQSQLLPNTTTITQRLDLLMRAVQQQLNTTQGITETFLQVHIMHHLLFIETLITYLQLVLNIVEGVQIKASQIKQNDTKNNRSGRNFN